MRLAFYILFLLFLSVLSLFIGVKEVSILDFSQWNEEEQLILTISRIPRTITLILAGIGISVSGLIMQQMTQNRFVSPTTAGTLDVAKLGILVGLLTVP